MLLTGMKHTHAHCRSHLSEEYYIIKYKIQRGNILKKVSILIVIELVFKRLIINLIKGEVRVIPSHVYIWTVNFTFLWFFDVS